MWIVPLISFALLALLIVWICWHAGMLPLNIIHYDTMVYHGVVIHSLVGP